MDVVWVAADWILALGVVVAVVIIPLYERLQLRRGRDGLGAFVARDETWILRSLAPVVDGAPRISTLAAVQLRAELLGLPIFVIAFAVGQIAAGIAQGDDGRLGLGALALVGYLALVVRALRRLLQLARAGTFRAVLVDLSAPRFGNAALATARLPDGRTFEVAAPWRALEGLRRGHDVELLLLGAATDPRAAQFLGMRTRPRGAASLPIRS